MEFKRISLFVLTVAVLAGCGVKTKSAAAEDKPADRVTVSSNEGSVDYYSSDEKRELLYSLKWEEGTATTLDKTHFYYKLSGVTGSLYKKGVLSSTFEADEGVADQSEGILTLQGDVQVHTANPKPKSNSTLFCEKMTYSDSDRIVKATGNVHVKGDEFTLGDFDELWSTPDLKTVASPEFFKAPPSFASDLDSVRHNLKSGSQSQQNKSGHHHGKKS